MHETGIAERIVALALEHARQAGAARITDLHLEIGEDAGASQEAVTFHVEEAARGTLVEGAALHYLPANDERALRLVWVDVECPQDALAPTVPAPGPAPVPGSTPA
jgi:Zn finger protein HypA/HybF involved in hydrogenase expression